MTRYIALLRGVNVGGKGRVAMADVRALLAEMGYTEVATYLQSGNAVFTAAAQPAGAIAAAIQDRMAATLGGPAAHPGAGAGRH